MGIPLIIDLALYKCVIHTYHMYSMKMLVYSGNIPRNVRNKKMINCAG